jgi:hypothetical protein
MGKIAAVIIGIIVLLAFAAFADGVTDKDQEEKRDETDKE